MAMRAGRTGRRSSLVVEVLPANELPPATPTDTANAERDSGGRFVAGNGVAKMRRAKTTIAGVRVDTSCDAYKPFGRWGRRYGGHRRGELAQAHGGSISAGVGALVESAALALSASRFLHDKAAATGDATLFVTAARLATDARQHELAAWELGAREAQARRTAGVLDTSAAERRLAEYQARQTLAAQPPEPELDEPDDARASEPNVEPDPEPEACRKCSAPWVELDRFCRRCGWAPSKPATATGVCTRCGAPWPENEPSCPSCGEVA